MKKIIILVLAINLLCSWTIIRVDRKENDANSATIFKVMMVVLGEKRTEEIFYDYYWNKLGENVDVPECLIKHYTVLSFKYSADFYNIKKFYWSTLQPVKISYKETEAIYNYIKKNDIILWLSPLPFNADSTCVSAWLRRWSGTVYGTYEVYPFPSEPLTEANYKKYLDT